MTLAEINQKIESKLDSLSAILEKKGFENFFKQKDAIKKYLHLTKKDINNLQEESYYFCQNKQWNDAIEALLYLVLFEPEQPYHYLRLGVVFMQTGKLEEALHTFQAATYLNPEDPTSLLYAGNCFLQLNQLNDARTAFQCCVDISKNNPEYKEVHDLANQTLQELR